MTASDLNPLQYQERVVAFVDVLGFAELVRKSENETTARAKLARLIATNNQFDQLIQKYLKPMEGAFFSDCFALSEDYPDHRAIYVIREAGNLWRFLFMLGLPCRGAIVTGSLLHRCRYIVGPALVRAYAAERDIAIYPRIIVDSTTVEHWNRETSPDSATEDLKPLVKRDHDGQYFLDLFHPKWADSFIPWAEIGPDQPTPTDSAEFIREARKQIDLGLEENAGNPKVAMKYEWLAYQLASHT